MAYLPSLIWISVAGREAPDWIVERMTTADINPDGSFEIEAADGPVNVQPGFAVFEVEGKVFACPSKEVREKLTAAVGTDNESVSELAHKTATMREQRNGHRAAAKRRASPLSDGYKLNIKPMIGAPCTPQNIALDQIEVDETYQRSIEGGPSRKQIIKIAENWDWRLCLPLIVSRRAGRLFVIDGQHRKEAADLRGDIPWLPCIVFDFDDPKQEAELFVEANRSRRQMSKLDDHHAAVVAGDPTAIAIHEVVTEAGLTVGRQQAWQYWKPMEIVFVKSVERLLRTQGKGPVLTALTMIARAFDGSTLPGGGAIFEGLVPFNQQRARDGNPVDEALMISVLANVGLVGWKEAVEGVDSASERADAMLRAITTAYTEAEAE